MIELLRYWFVVDCRSSCVVHWLLSVCCGLCVMGCVFCVVVCAGCRFAFWVLCFLYVIVCSVSIGYCLLFDARCVLRLASWFDLLLLDFMRVSCFLDIRSWFLVYGSCFAFLVS